MEPKHPPEATQLRSGLIILLAQQEALQKQVGHLLKKTDAKLILLVDMAGQVIVADGIVQEDKLVAFGVLIASDLAANHEIAVLSGEPQPYQITLREGIHSTSVVMDIDQIAALFVQFSHSLSTNKICKHIRKTSQQISLILNECSHNKQPLLTENDPDQLNALFEQELDAMWME